MYHMTKAYKDLNLIIWTIWKLITSKNTNLLVDASPRKCYGVRDSWEASIQSRIPLYYLYPKGQEQNINPRNPREGSRYWLGGEENLLLYRGREGATYTGV